MPRALANRTPRGRFSYEQIVDEIALRIQEAPRGTTARLARVLGLEIHQFSHRMRGVKARFSIEQLGVIADRIVETRDGAPVGWPFYPWAICMRLMGSEWKEPSARPARRAGGHAPVLVGKKRTAARRTKRKGRNGSAR